MPNARGQPWGTHFSALARGGYPNPSPGVPPPAASAPMSEFASWKQKILLWEDIHRIFVVFTTENSLQMI